MWIVGYNQAGYLPDTEPDVFKDWHDARAALIAAMELEMEAYRQTAEFVLIHYPEADTDAYEMIAVLDRHIDQAKAIRYFAEASFACNGVEFWLKRQN